MKPKESLKLKHKHMMSIVKWNGKRHENVPIQDDWLEFESFYKLNKARYYRAIKKWKNYKNVTKDGNGLNTNIHFIRKNKELGFTKENTVFTSPSDRMKYHNTAVNLKISDNGALLGKRDVQNLLKKKGLNLTMGSINTRMKKGKDLFSENRLSKYKWKGKNMSLVKISELESIDHNLLSNKVYIDKFQIEKAVDYCKKFKRRTVFLDGKEMSPTEACFILAKRYKVSHKAMISRFYKNDGNLDKICYSISKNKHSPYPKKVELRKGDFVKTFDSINSAAEYLNRNPSNLSTLLKGRGKTINKHTARFV